MTYIESRGRRDRGWALPCWSERSAFIWWRLCPFTPWSRGDAPAKTAFFPLRQSHLPNACFFSFFFFLVSPVFGLTRQTHLIHICVSRGRGPCYPVVTLLFPDSLPLSLSVLFYPIFLELSPMEICLSVLQAWQLISNTNMSSDQLLQLLSVYHLCKLACWII